MEQGATFDEVADLYDAARPGYPDALFTDIVRAAGLTAGDPILEVGCGTGKATAGFAQQGLRIVALDPGADLIRVARSSLASFDDITFVAARFEDWPAPAAAFKLVAAAQAAHWIAPEVFFAKAAMAMAPGGWLAIFGNVPVPRPSLLLDEFHRIYAQHIPGFEPGPPPEAWYLPGGPLPRLFDDSRRFGAVTHQRYPWRQPHTTASFIDLSHTQSYHRMLPPAQREALFTALAAAIDAQGGRLDLAYETHLHMAPRL
ncbi:class I SAM-dependent methyltransferase [Vineibacter terrae]|uniref:class I SAM-dependent methyltransferase n=1 Tax=Vineibacter terrae TaxID=2586908 RepID=UPI002E31243B|nr:class I SAM-dependent methyltransferase [Vineibacter terrae]HEX2890836.1 class I SAM-dependent methyltransferase [Vineibacter terrae]